MGGIAWGASVGGWARRVSRICSISAICCLTSCRRVMSRCSSAMVLAGRATPCGVRSAPNRSGALRKFGLKLPMPRRAKVLFIRLVMRVRSPTSVSRSRLGRRASASSSVGIAAILQ
jgi:hypothetical protein